MDTIVVEKISIVEIAIDELMSLITGKSILTSREAGVQEEIGVEKDVSFFYSREGRSILI